MERKIGIRGKYVQVERKENGEVTFGGDQGFFYSDHMTKTDERKKESGCGVVAFTDLLLYLGSRDKKYRIPETDHYIGHVLRKEEYKNCYNTIYSFLGGIPFKGGISCLSLRIAFNRLSRRQNWNLRASWGICGKKLFDRIEEMLAEDIPVILCIPMMILKKDRKDGLWLYQRTEEPDGTYSYHQKAFARAHYIIITNVIQERDTVFYEISSWGKKYYFSKNEYDILIHTHFTGTILGNILYIRQHRQRGTVK